jgi:hypothetical protein
MLKEELDAMEKTLASNDTLEALKQKYQANYYLNLVEYD